MENSRCLREKDRTCFTRPAEEVAPWLLGKILCRLMPNGAVQRFRITETEAYPYEDPACYGHNGKKTPANALLFEQGGTCCLFGGMFLISCEGRERSSNVLIRCVGDEKHYYIGSWKVYEAIKEGEEIDNYDLLTSDTIWLEDDGAKRDIYQTRRLRVTGEWKNKPLRFIAI